MGVNLCVCQSEMGCSASRQVFRPCLLCMYSIFNSSSTVIVDTEVPRLVSYRRRQDLGMDGQISIPSRGLIACRGDRD